MTHTDYISLALAILIGVAIIAVVATSLSPVLEFTEPQTHVVQPGETLWAIASMYYDDVLYGIHRLQEVNGCDALIYPYDILEVR